MIRKLTCVFGLLCAIPATLQAQWSDNFDSYSLGSLHGQGGWKGWFNSPTNGGNVVNTTSLSAPNSAEVAGLTDAVHEYSGYTSGQWRYSANVFVPTAFTVQGEIAFFILLSNYADTGTNLHWSVQLELNSAGTVTDTNGNGTSTPTTLIRNQWVPITVDIDLTNNTRLVKYNGITVMNGTWRDASALSTLNIGAVDLFANSDDVTPGSGNTVPVYFDNMSLTPVPEPASLAALGIGALALLRRRRDVK